VFPDQFTVALRLDPEGVVTAWLADLHFGRFNGITQVVWAIIGLAPAVLAVTGVFICCRRVMLHKPSNPNHFIA
jgi:uncharacterized iron-regulated membrane protein